MKTFTGIFILLFSLAVLAQYSSANQHTPDNDESNNYQSGYVNDYSKDRQRQDEEAAQNLPSRSGTGFTENYNYYDKKQQEVERIIPRRNKNPHSRDSERNSPSNNKTTRPVI